MWACCWIITLWNTKVKSSLSNKRKLCRTQFPYLNWRTVTRSKLMVHSVSKVKKENTKFDMLSQQRNLERKKRGNLGWSSDINTVFFFAWWPLPTIHSAVTMETQHLASTWTGARSCSRAEAREVTVSRGGIKNPRRQTRRSGTAWHFGVWVSAAARPCHFVGPDASVKVRPSFPVLNDKRIITSPQLPSCWAPWAVQLPSPFFLLLHSHPNTARLRHHLLMCSEADEIQDRSRCQALCFPSAVLSGSSSLVEHIKGILNSNKKKKNSGRATSAWGWKTLSPEGQEKHRRMEKQWVWDGGGQMHTDNTRTLFSPAGCSEMSGNTSRWQCLSRKWERVQCETTPPSGFPLTHPAAAMLRDGPRHDAAFRAQRQASKQSSRTGPAGRQASRPAS